MLKTLLLLFQIFFLFEINVKILANKSGKWLRTPAIGTYMLINWKYLCICQKISKNFQKIVDKIICTLHINFYKNIHIDLQNSGFFLPGKGTLNIVFILLRWAKWGFLTWTVIFGDNFLLIIIDLNYKHMFKIIVVSDIFYVR